jgi:hypothetical protein
MFVNMIMNDTAEQCALSLFDGGFAGCTIDCRRLKNRPFICIINPPVKITLVVEPQVAWVSERLMAIFLCYRFI